MVLDAQALQHLEVVESAKGSVDGTLLQYLDHCKTQFGKRQLKRWVLAPLQDASRINLRLDAVEDLMLHQSTTDKFRMRLSKMPDLEKLLAKVFTYSIQNTVNAVFFEDVSLIKMRDFRNLLKCLNSIRATLAGLQELCDQRLLKSSRLIALLST